MALDLYLQKDSSIPKTLENRFLAFEDDGYFGFLCFPYFEEISRETGKEIIPWDDAFFDGKDLDLFDRMIEQVRRELKQKPDVWEEFIGTIIHKGERKIEKRYSTVHEAEMEAILLKLEKAVSKAKRKNLGIFFFGD